MDILFNFRNDISNPNGDPDSSSLKLKLIHEQLWSKPLPDGRSFELKARSKGIDGFINGKLKFIFNPDSFVNTLSKSKRFGFDKLVGDWRLNNKKIDLELNKYYSEGYTIGESIIFPIQDDKGSSKYTINKARGMHPHVQDRTDLTLECVRHFYLGEKSPLSSCFDNYSSFFNLFGVGQNGFENYVKWFYLDDLVSSDYKTVVPFTKSLDFVHPQPITEDDYLIYLININAFVKKRNERLLANYPNIFEKPR